MKFIILFSVLALLSLTDGYKILVLGPFYGKSHVLYMQSFVRKLLERSHEVTFVTSVPFGNDNIANYTEVLIDPPLDLSTIFPTEKLFELSKQSAFTSVGELIGFLSYSTNYTLNSKSVRELINRNDLHFDVVINEEFFHDAFSMFGYRFKAPVITICPYGNSDFFDRQMGHLTPWSHVPHMQLTYSDNMSFTERWFNTILSIYDALLRYFVHYPLHNAMAQQYFGHLGPLPSIEEVNRNVSLILVNAHRSIFPPRPSMPNIISIGGAHIEPPKPLPANIKKFLDEATHGAIYFSLGTVILGSKMPEEKISSFLNVFRKLKQRVLWKYEDDSLTEIPSNVMIQKWMPQNDILAHPNIKLFISHAGVFGTYESIAHGVPLVMIPFFGDQYRNAKRITNAGYGRMLEFKNVNERTVAENLLEMLTNESYSKKAKELSAIFNHNLVHPMDEAMWWIEYVAKFKGAKHLKSHAVNMSWFSYLLLDVIGVTLIGIFAVIFIMIYLVKKLCCRKTKQNIAKSNKKTN